MRTYYRVIASGQWCGPVYENGGAHPDAIAETLGLEAGAVEAVEAETDPLTVDLLADPNIAAPEQEPEPTPIAQLVEALAADPNLAAETKTALQAIAGGDITIKPPLTPVKG